MDKVAVVILNWNGCALLEKFLPSVLNYTDTSIANIYVIDNYSKDNSCEFIRINYPTVKLIELNKNYGFPGGYNLGLKQISAKYFVLLNNDVELSENWLNPLYSLMETNENIAACQPKILSYNKPNEFEYSGAAGGFIDKLGYPFCRGRLFNVFEKDKGQYNFVDEVFWATGACLMIRADLYNENGGLDEDFFAHMEEIDLCWRLKNKGYKIYYQGNSTVYHLGGATLSHNNPNKVYLNFRNNLYLLYKNLPSNNLARILIIRLFLDAIAAFKFLVGFDLQAFKAVIRAHYAFWSTRKKFKTKRLANISSTINHNHSSIYNGSLVWDFFIKKKKYFYQLNFKK